MKMIKIGKERLDASQIRNYWPDDRSNTYIIDVTFKDKGVGNYIVFGSQIERDAAINKLDAALGVLGIHSEDDAL